MRCNNYVLMSSSHSETNGLGQSGAVGTQPGVAGVRVGAWRNHMMLSQTSRPIN